VSSDAKAHGGFF
jgi:replication factor C subunit 3/5